MSTKIPIHQGVGWRLYTEMLDGDSLYIELEDTMAVFLLHKYQYNSSIEIKIPDEMLSLFNDEIQKKIREIKYNSEHITDPL